MFMVWPELSYDNSGFFLKVFMKKEIVLAYMPTVAVLEEVQINSIVGMEYGGTNKKLLTKNIGEESKVFKFLADIHDPTRVIYYDNTFRTTEQLRYFMRGHMPSYTFFVFDTLKEAFQWLSS